tara:strand:+ start:32984 stop:35530 length:2547 start_codon:yes stop_codon:yes gene_type:complete
MSAQLPVELRVYPNQFKNDDFEKIECAAGITLHDYLISNVPSYHERPIPLFSVLLNDKPLPFNKWKTEVFLSGDLIECIIEPKGVETAIMVVIAVASAAYAIHMANQPLPDTYNNTSPKGSSIYDVNAQGNRYQLMGTVPVLFGRHPIYPDYLNPPRTIYKDNKKILYVMLSCFVEVGEVLPEDILIGDTQVSKFGSDISYQIFQPGEDVSGHDAHLTEYRSVEVGSSDGGSGLELKGTSYALDWVAVNLGVYYSWKVRSNPKQLGFYRSVKNGDALYDFNLYPWQEEYNSATGETLIGRALEFFDPNDASLGIYRAVSESGSGSLVVFEKLNSDFTIDESWTGFGVEDYHFQARYLVLNVDNDVDLVGPFSAVPFGEVTDKLIFDFRLNNGLARLDSSGGIHEHYVKIEIQWRLSESDDWQKKVQVYTAATRDQLAYTLEILLPAGSQPDVKIRRLTPSSDDILIKDTIEWVALRSSLKSATSYPGITTIAFEITGTDELANAAENKISILPTRELLKFNSSGEMTSFGPTRSISSALYAVADELGYEIDMDELWRLHQVWESRGDYFDALYDNPSTAWKVFQQILAVGFAEPTLDFGKIIPVRDEQRTSLCNQYQPDNILPGTWKMSGSFFDESDNDGIEVEYLSVETRKPETVMCLLPNDAGENVEKVRAFGITDKTQAYRYGMRKRATQKHRRIKHAFSTEMDALNSRYMSYDALGIDMPGYSQTGHIESISGRTLNLNQDLEWGDSSQPHYMGVRKLNGKVSGPYLCSPSDTASSVVIDRDLDFVPLFDGDHEPPYFLFGVADQWCLPILVTDIKPSGTDKVNVTAFEYSDKVYLYDDAVPAD